MTFAADRLQTRHVTCLHGCRSETELSDCALQDTRYRLCCEATLRGEHGTRGMEVGAGFPVYHRPGSLRYSLLRGATQRHSEIFRSSARQRPAPAF